MKRSASVIALSAALAPMALGNITLTGSTVGGPGSYIGWTDPNKHFPGQVIADDMTYLAASSATQYLSQLNQQFPPSIPYTSATTGTALSGTLDVSRFGFLDNEDPNSPDYANNPKKGDPSVTVIMSATYTPAPGESSSYAWLQVINTNVPQQGYTSPYFDIFAQKPRDGTPFYPPNMSIPGFSFGDTPTRPKPGHTAQGIGLTTTWSAELYLCSYTPNPNGGMGGGIVIHDGVRWGFKLKSLSQEIVTPPPPPPYPYSMRAQAVPEPSTLLGLMSTAFLALRRRAKRSAKP